MLNIYRLLRLALPTYFAYPILIVVCGLMCVFSLIGLWIPFFCTTGIFLLYILCVIGCKGLQNWAIKQIKKLPGGDKLDSNQSLIRGHFVATKIRFRTPDGHYSTTEVADQYEAAMLVVDMLHAQPGTKYNMKVKVESKFGRGMRYDWKPVCGNLPFD